MFNRKKHKKTPYLNPDAMICSLGVVKKTGDNKYDQISYGVAIGEEKNINEDGTIIRFVEDSLVDNNAYIILNQDEVEKAIRNGDLLEDEPYCYSMYSSKSYDFKEIYKMESEEEIKNHLIEYNKKNNVAIYWTFLDDEEIKEMDKIKENSIAKYLEFKF